MPSQAALALFLAFIGWLFVRDIRQRDRQKVSPMGWLPLAWVFILGSRPLSLWLSQGGNFDSPEEYLEGNQMDRLLFAGLIVAGVAVVAARRGQFQPFIKYNRWLFLLCVYWGISAIWAESPFVAFKRWFKDMGSVVMVLVILSEKDPVEAIRAVMARATFLLIPLSVLVIRWYPGLGRSFNRWTGESFYQGVTTNKNQLGITLTVCTLFIVWDLLRMWKGRRESRPYIDFGNRMLLLLMSFWLLRVAHSATSLACTAFGIAGILFCQLRIVQQHRRHLLRLTIMAALLMLYLSLFIDIPAIVAKSMGRDPSLHGRTEIWSMVLAEKSNPVIGAGFYSFWTSERVNRFLDVYSFVLTQAHNGYMETYLNGGLVGLGLLLAVIFAGGAKIQRRLMTNPDWGVVSLILWLTILVHNWTEASFNKLSLLWFAMLLICIEYPRWRKTTRPARVPIQSEPCGMGQVEITTSLSSSQ